jgi:hypothetical protein
LAYQATTGLGVAANIVVEGNQGPSQTPGHNTVLLSLSGTGAPETFQLSPSIVDAGGNEISPGTAFTLTAVAGSSVGPLTLSAVAAPSGGTAVYTGTITGGGSSAFAGYTFNITGFTNATNNGTFLCTASSTTTLTLVNTASIAETHAGTAVPDQGTAVYTGTITGGGSSAFAGQSFLVAGFVTNPSNNGTFVATASSATTLTLANPDAIAETHAATATSQESGTNEITFVSYSSGTATVSSTGLITSVAEGGAIVEVSYPTFNNSVGAVVSSGNVMNGLPIMKIYAEVNVTVVK